MRCPYCNSDDVIYVGVDDGFFDDAVCDIYRCEDCGEKFEGHCIGIEEMSWEQQAVDEIIAEEKPNEYPPGVDPNSRKDYLHDDLFYRLHKRDDPF